MTSGGGSGLVATHEANAAGGARVDEARLFDALDGDHIRLLRLAVARHALERTGTTPGALAIIARPGSFTEAPPDASPPACNQPASPAPAGACC